MKTSTVWPGDRSSAVRKGAAGTRISLELPTLRAPVLRGWSSKIPISPK